MGSHALLKITSPEHAAIRAKIIEYITKGSHPKVAFEAAGLSHGLYLRYQKIVDGREANWKPSGQVLDIILDFMAEVRRAEAMNETDVVSFVKQEAMQDADTAIKYLSRRYPTRWAEQRHQTTVSITWQIQAATMLQTGEVTLEALEEEFGKDVVEAEILPLLPPPKMDNIVIDGEAHTVVSVPTEEPIPARKVQKKRAGVTAPPNAE